MAITRNRFRARLGLFLTPLMSYLLMANIGTAGATDPSAAPSETNGYLQLGFDRLSNFVFNPAGFDPAKPNEAPPSSFGQVPDRVKQWDGHKAVITGFMLPVKTDKGLVTEFLLLKNQMMCCYGTVPNMNEWVIVRAPQGVPATQDIPLAIYGRLHVKEVYDNGYLAGIYLLEEEKIADATP